MSKPFQSDYIQKATVFENTVSGKLRLPGSEHELAVTFSLEEDNEPSLEAFHDLIEASQVIVEKLVPAALASLDASISKELTNAAYSQSDYKPVEEDYKKLTKDLVLTEINFYEGDAMMCYTSPNIFTGQEIFVQINEDLEIEDIIVE